MLKSYQHFINYRLEHVQTSAHLVDVLRELQHQFQDASTASADHWEEFHNRRRVALFGVLCPEEMRQLLQEMLLTPLHVISFVLLNEDQRAHASMVCDSILSETCDCQPTRSLYYKEIKFQGLCP